MSSNEALAREYMESVNARDWDRMRSCLNQDYSYTAGDGQTLTGGPEVGIGIAKMFTGAFSDARTSIEKIHVAGDTVVIEFTGFGTHDGQFRDVPPTGRTVTMPIIMALDIRDGKVFAEREYMDMAHLLQQLGVMAAPATA